jgi:hypothetical protein
VHPTSYNGIIRTGKEGCALEKSVYDCIIDRLKAHDDAAKNGEWNETMFEDQKSIITYIRQELDKLKE